MEQNKLEKQFKEKLNSREIKPTEMAWDRLNSMLSVAELSDTTPKNRQPKRKLSWLYIAASFIVFLLISTVYFYQKENTIDIENNTVVFENTIPKENSKTKIESKTSESAFSKTTLKSETKLLVQNQKKAKTEVENPTLKTPEDAVAEIQSKNKNESVVEHKNTIPENVNNLLASVEKNPKSDVKNSSVKINPTDLLNQVDGELQLSFREKALNTITQKYKEAKEAVANRNNQ